MNQKEDITFFDGIKDGIIEQFQPLLDLLSEFQKDKYKLGCILGYWGSRFCVGAFLGIMVFLIIVIIGIIIVTIMDR